jgi:hypothetical protein
MRLTRILYVKKALAALLLTALVGGCGGGQVSTPTGDLNDGERHILGVAQLWSEYKRSNGKREPASAEVLKNWAKQKLKPEQLARMGITDLDKAIISPRDGEPYGFRSAAKDNPMGMGTVIYEKTGVNGNHLVANNMGGVATLTDAELGQLPK